MSEPSANTEPPAFVLRMRAALAEAVARHAGHLDLHHDHRLDRGVDGWQSTVRPAGHPQVEAVFWYDSGDRDVMFWGDAPYREWFLLGDLEDGTLNESSVEICLREVQDVVDDLAGAGRDGAIAQAARRARRNARPRWRRLLGPGA